MRTNRDNSSGAKQVCQSDQPSILASRIHASPWVILFVLTFGFFMILLDTTIVQVAMPRMEEGLDIGFDQVLWVINGYTLVYAVLLITAARLGDMFGPKRLFLTGVAVFTLGSGACGFAQTGTELILSRLVQAAGGALLAPQTMSMINTLFPPARRGAAFGVWGIVAGASTSVGPVLGGYLVTTFDWQAIFFINVPVGLAAMAAAYLLMPEIRFRGSHHLDPRGVVLVSTALFLGMFALVEGQRSAWGPIDGFGAVSLGPTRWSLVSAYSLFVYAAFVLALFVLLERRASQPLLPFPLFRDRNFTAGSALSIAVSFATTSMFVPAMLFMQSVLGWSATQSGLTALSSTLVMMIVAPLAGRLSDHLNPKYLLLAGCGLSAVGVGLVVDVLALDDTSWTFAIPLAVAGLGMGCTMVPMVTVAMRGVAPALSGAASGFFNTLRGVGAAMGTAVVGAVLANRVAADLPRQAARHVTQLPADLRPQFLAYWRAAGASVQQFGAGQTMHFGVPVHASPETARQIAAVYRDTFASAFLNGARPALSAVAVALVAGALVATQLRGGM